MEAEGQRFLKTKDERDFFTLIEVVAHDRIGFLYQVTRIFFELGLDIRIAKIATRGDQVADIFYVLDVEGQKVEDRLQVEAIRTRLLQELQHRRRPGTVHPGREADATGSASVR